MISVIVPVYKSEKTLERCIESLLAQRETELEIILVDDGSPDGCPAICDAYASREKRVRVLHRENGGVSSARNAGIEEAKGMYVAFVDSDDYVEPDYCASLQRALEKGNGQLAVCGYHHHYVGADVEKIPRSQADLLTLYETGFLNMPWNKLFLREGLGRFPEELSLGEDLLFNLEYLKSHPRVTLAEQPLYHYIQEESGSTLSSRKREDKLELAKRIRREAEGFFLSQLKEREEDPKGERQERIGRVVDTRFLCECLDDVERLPFDREMTGRQRRAVIRSFCMEKEVRTACRRAAPKQLDYRMLKWSMGHGQIGLTDALSVLRSFAVRLKRRFRL